MSITKIDTATPPANSTKEITTRPEKPLPKIYPQKFESDLIYMGSMVLGFLGLIVTLAGAAIGHSNCFTLGLGLGALAFAAYFWAAQEKSCTIAIALLILGALAGFIANHMGAGLTTYKIVSYSLMGAGLLASGLSDVTVGPTTHKHERA